MTSWPVLAVFILIILVQCPAFRTNPPSSAAHTHLANQDREGYSSPPRNEHYGSSSETPLNNAKQRTMLDSPPFGTGPTRRELSSQSLTFTMEVRGSGGGIGSLEATPRNYGPPLLTNQDNLDKPKRRKQSASQSPSDQALHEVSNIPYHPDETSDLIQELHSAWRPKEYLRHFLSTNRGLEKPPTFHGNQFKCPPCNCATTHRGNIVAHCVREKLRNIPTTLRPDTWSLDMSENCVSNLNISAITQYPNLAIFILSRDSKLTRISNESVTSVNSTIRQLDLSNNKISVLEDNSLEFMPLLLNLSLRGNSLRAITNMTFGGLDSLKTLDLSSNSILTIDTGAFDHLVRLKTLNISHNPRFSYSPYRMPPRLFSKLVALKNLYIQGNSGGNRQYPNAVVGVLSNLRMLVIDGLHSPATLGPEMGSLRRLELGTNGGICLIVNLTLTYFENVPHLTFLSLNDCHFKQVNPSAYAKMPNLDTLSLTHGRETYGLVQAFEDLSGLQFSRLKSLTLSKMAAHSYPCVFLKGEQGRYLYNISLEKLDLSFNHIALLQQDFIQRLPPTLKTLDLSENALNTKYSLLNQLNHVKNLRELDVSNQNRDPRPHKFPPQEDALRLTCHYKWNCALDQDASSALEPIDVSSVNILPYPEQTADAHWNDSINPNLVRGGSETAEYLGASLPPKLQVLKAAEYTNFAIDLFLDAKPNHKLQEVDFSSSFMSKWGFGKIIKSIQRADLSKNYCKNISRNFFPSNNSLQYVDISSNFLGEDFARDFTGETFQELRNVHYLDIRTNLIYKLPHEFFHGLSSLEYLDISDNKLQNLNASFAANPRLRAIDASKNSITWVGKRTREDLDNLASRHPFSLDLSLNPLPCSCEGLDVIGWLATTKVTILNRDFLKCRLHDARIEDIGDLSVRLRQLERTCAGKTLIIATCATSAGVFLTFLSLSLAYRYRWRLLYLRNVALTRMLSYRPKNAKGGGAASEEFVYDVFVIQTESSGSFVMGELRRELGPRRGHKLCLSGLDLRPGGFMVTDIVAAVMQSRTVLVVVTPDLAEDGYAEYSIKMALCEEHFHKREALFLLELDPAELKVGREGVVQESDDDDDDDEEEDEEDDDHDDDDNYNDDDTTAVIPAPAEEEEEDDPPDYDKTLNDADLLKVRLRGSFIELPVVGKHGVTEHVRQNAWDRLSQVIGHTSNTRQQAYVDG